MEKNLHDLQINVQTTNANIAHLQVFSTRHENLFTKIILPMMNDLSKFILYMNQDKHGKIIDADFGVSLERSRTQLNNALKGKEFC